MHVYYHITQSGADTGFSEGGGDGHKGRGVIAPVGEKLLFEHTKFSATMGGDLPRHHPPGSATASKVRKLHVYNTLYETSGNPSTKRLVYETSDTIFPPCLVAIYLFHPSHY